MNNAAKDRFVLRNTSQCALNDLAVHLDLSNRVGHLIFNTTATSADVEAFQPFEVKKGHLKQFSLGEVKEEDSTFSISVDNIAANDCVGLAIDVDDILTDSELGNIRVPGSEITNALIRTITKE